MLQAVLLNSFVYKFSWSSLFSNYWATLYLVYSPYWGFCRPSSRITKPPNARSFHLFHNRSYLNFLANTFTPNHILTFCQMYPLIQCNIVIYKTLGLFSYWIFTAQHSIPYNIANQIINVTIINLFFEHKKNILMQCGKKKYKERE